MKVVTPSKTNPKPDSSQGMEVFLAQSPSHQPKEEKMKVQANPQPSNPQPGFEEMIKEINEIEQKLLKKNKELELSAFNKLVYEKNLLFKLLFIRSKIIVYVRDPQTNKSTVITIESPRWGGSSLRYIMSCVEDWCRVIEKDTSKGKILTYQPVSLPSPKVDIDDIFD